MPQHKFVRCPSGTYIISLDGDPPENVHSIPMSSDMPVEIQKGLWLLLNVAIWSVPDLEAVATGIEVAKLIGPEVHLGIRPFDYHEELHALYPHMETKTVSPVWILLQDGKMVGETFGTRTVKEIDNLIRSHLLT